MLLFLVGFMGCGKSTLGRKAAQETGFGFADTDALVEEETGKTVAEIFERDGEETFRSIESRVLRSLCAGMKDAGCNTIVATGGGTPCHDGNLAMMKRCGIVVYLRRSPENLFRILEVERLKRPKTAGLDDADLRRFIERSLGERERFYLQSAARIDCNGIGDEEVVRRIIAIAEAEKIPE